MIKTKSGFLKQDGVHKNLIEENELGRKSLKAGGNPGHDFGVTVTFKRGRWGIRVEEATCR